jgi:hypothetical protein
MQKAHLCMAQQIKRVELAINKSITKFKETNKLVTNCTYENLYVINQHYPIQRKQLIVNINLFLHSFHRI